MEDHIIKLSETSRAAIDAAVTNLFFTQRCEDGTELIELDADYRDTNEFLLRAAYDHRNAEGDGLIPKLKDLIQESYPEYIEERAYEILTDAGFAPHDPFDEWSFAAREYLQEKYRFVPPYDHFLDQTMKVNIMLQTPEDANCDHGLIKDQFLAMSWTDELRDSSPAAIEALLSQDSSLKRLVEQQGFTMSALAETVRDYIHDFWNPNGPPAKYLDNNGKALPYETRMDLFTAGRSRFLTSLCEELDNQTYSVGCITVLAEVSMKDFAEMMKPGSEISMPCDSTAGIFDPWGGSGSILGIQLAKNLVFKREDIYDVQIEGVTPDFGYTLDNTYGMVGSAWRAPVSISASVPDRKPGLDNIISSAQQRALQPEKNSPGRDDLTH